MEHLQRPIQLLEPLKQHYVNPSQPGSFSGFANFFRGLKKAGIERRPNEVKRWLMSQDTYTLHKPVRKNYQRNKVIVPGIDHTWQIDLVDLRNIAWHNSYYRYLVCCIDVFSKFAWVVPTKYKTGIEIKNAFEKILESNRKPKYLQADKGTEFFNNEFRPFLTALNIRLYAIVSDKKACIVERFNRTLKEKMFRYFSYTKTKKYLDVLDDLVSSYNKSYHRSIKMCPADVNLSHVNDIWKFMYMKDSKGPVVFKYKVGDYVRVKIWKDVFEKGYTPNWEEELFVITHRYPKVPAVYKVKALLTGRVLPASYYAEELQKVFPKETDLFQRVKKILRLRIRNGAVEYFVRWLGYTSDFDTWIPAAAYRE
jgi:hypothetical protein